MTACGLCGSSTATITARVGDVRCADVVSCEARREAQVVARQNAAHAKLAGALSAADVALADRAREAEADRAIRRLVGGAGQAPPLWALFAPATGELLDVRAGSLQPEPLLGVAWVAVQARPVAYPDGRVDSPRIVAP